ncbi:hypothetical protein [Bradyrhizobium sp. CCBAU 53380]|uniref:hypothetical protein n=1 Tax=Bradyrhizobium sp. CCBAU 53380 TaxID=1325117 RepID=UPI00230275AA|nr:hypothetical protein [Bradyrhizobium sp. CCBAU 53380]
MNIARYGRISVEPTVERLQLPLHLSNPGSERVDELDAQQGGRLRRFPRLPFGLAQLVGFDSEMSYSNRGFTSRSGSLSAPTCELIPNWSK